MKRKAATMVAAIAVVAIQRILTRLPLRSQAADTSQALPPARPGRSITTPAAVEQRERLLLRAATLFRIPITRKWLPMSILLPPQPARQKQSITTPVVVEQRARTRSRAAKCFRTFTIDKWLPKNTLQVLRHVRQRQSITIPAHAVQKARKRLSTEKCFRTHTTNK